MNVSPIVKYRTLGISKSMTPIDTGNVRHNATKLTRVKQSKWSITYSLKDAYYIEILEDGTLNNKTVNGRTPRKFIERTSLVLASYLKGFYEGKPQSKWVNSRLKITSETEENNIDRNNRHFESKFKMGNTRWR